MKDQSLQMRYKQKALTDRLTRYFVASGGISTITAMQLIFFYLLYIVIPMFEPAKIKRKSHLCCVR